MKDSGQRSATDNSPQPLINKSVKLLTIDELINKKASPRKSLNYSSRNDLVK
jgi:hypothetical protein